MYALLACLFAGFFLLNMYFRIKVWKSYNTLSRHGVKFAAVDIFSEEKMSEIKQTYPGHDEDLDTFARHMRNTLRMATVFVILIIIFGLFLFRQNEN